MAATSFQVELPTVGIPSGGDLVRFVNRAASIPPMGFTNVASGGPSGGSGDTYPSSGSPVAPANGIGFFTISSGLIDATGNNSKNRFLWIAPAACQVVGVEITASVLEATGAAITFKAQRVPTGVAIAAGGAFDLVATPVNVKTGLVANTPLNMALNATLANLVFAATDQLAIVLANNPVTEFQGVASIHINFI